MPILAKQHTASLNNNINPIEYAPNQSQNNNIDEQLKNFEEI